jgi:EAL domain-containing protein (putative c-di-GMP-specific phosphodiesterase class I)
VATFPFRVGRSPEAALSLPIPAVSWSHAELFAGPAGLVLRDLGSTNGTWVNGERLRAEAPLAGGDRVQFASVEFVVREERRPPKPEPTAPAQLSEPDGEGSPHALRTLLRHGTVDALFQPVVAQKDGVVVGFEALGRALAPGLPRSVQALFVLAAKTGLELELSQAFRRRAAQLAGQLPPGSLIFLNTHPLETHLEGLVNEIIGITEALPELRFVVEIHEAAITDPKRMRALSDRLADLGVALAYDDFGAGQARLAELADAPPQYLKFDRSLIHHLDEAEPRRQQLVTALVNMAHDLGVIPLAEGVERAGEAAFCRDLGFTLAQGFHYGRPAPASTWAR